MKKSCELNCSGLVQGIGTTPFDQLPPNPLYFTELSVAETVFIPKNKPEAEQLISVTVEAEVVSLRVVPTATGSSLEGQTLSGHKLIVELKLRQKIKYVADEPTQKVHAAHFEKNINSLFVVVPSTINGIPIETLLANNRLNVVPYIEDIFASLSCKRTVFKNITILVDVTYRD